MQKKIIALAVAGLVSGAAFAQSNVVIYGIADMGYVYADDFAGTSASAKNTDAIHKMYSGGQSGSRLGFKGTEDLGNGLAANFRFESGFNMDNGGAAQNGSTFSRWATVGLSGKNWGEVQFGRRDTLSDEIMGGLDTNGRVTVAQVSPIMKDVARWDNMATYISPVMGGLVLKAAVSTNVSDGQAAAPVGANYKSEVNAAPVGAADANNLAKTNVYGYALSARYDNGPLKLGAQYDYYDPQSVDGSNFDTGNQWTIAGRYDFGVVQLALQYGEINYGKNVSGVSAAGYSGCMVESNVQNCYLDKRTQWTAGVMIPVSARARVAVAYAYGEDQFLSSANRKDEDQSMWGISAFYDLSKRTNLYAAYGDISQDQDNKYLVGIDGQDKYQKAFQVGVRHQF